ncbi:MAG: hypothetical protein NBV67_00120 [Tagaea sp.]|nr:hypothetical protein [Tagaea sp.]
MEVSTRTLDTGAVVVVADTITTLDARHSGHVVVCASHGGVSSGEFALKYDCAGVFFNDAGIGKEQAGVAGVLALDAYGIPSAGVDNASAAIGDGCDTWDNGVVSFANATASARGVRPGVAVMDAASRIAVPTAPRARGSTEPHRADLFHGLVAVQGRTFNLCDSISMIDASDLGRIVVSGSHGGAVSAVYALRHRPAVVFFNDAGIGKGRAGIRALDILGEAGVPAGAVTHLSARIGDARDSLETGIIGHLNGPAQANGLEVGMRLREIS